MKQIDIVDAVRAGMAAGDGAVFSDIEFSADARLHSRKAYANAVNPFDLHIGKSIWHRMRKPVWRGIHFRRCAISGLAFTGALVEDCSFEDCELKIQNWKTVYRDCRFSSCDMRSFVFGANTPVDGNSFDGVTFDNCDMRGNRLSHATFANVRVINCRLERAEFPQARIKDSRFIGKVTDVSFGRGYTPKPTVLANVDFTQAIPSCCVFANACVSGLKPPENPRVHVVPRYRDFLAALDREIRADADIEDIRVIEIFGGDYGDGDEFGIVNEDDFAGILKPEGMALLAHMLTGPEWR